MSKQTSILSGILISVIILVQSEYVRQKDKVLNKGVWVKSDNLKLYGKSSFGDFIFNPNSINAEDDDLFQNDFYSLGSNNLQDYPFMPNYVDRAKRSPNIFEDGFGKSISDCTGKDCNLEHSPNKKSIIKAKFTLTPYINPSASEQPYDAAVLMGKAKNNNKIMLEEVIEKSNVTNEPNKTFEVIMANEILVDNSDNNATITTLPKRSMNKDYESEIIKKIEIVEGLNESKKYDRNIFDDKVRNWPGNGQDVNIYKVIPKTEDHATVSEKGLLKLLSILAKTFKKIMKQHLEIKKIHHEMVTGKDDIDKSVTLLIAKFNDFETKYSGLKEYHEKIQQIQNKLDAKEEYFKNKEKEMAINLADFEHQQKKFLTQQRQFYNIQKLMLAQNEKINAKQGIIAKTQSEISRRQNNFARILKKIKQVFGIKKQTQLKTANNSQNSIQATTSTSTTTKPETTESIKIDLFSIPSVDSQRLLNQDQLILNEKDEHPVDDLVYKYYFNNTFIDNLMRNQILSGTLQGNKFMTRNVKVKRNEGKKVKSTVLIPIDNNAIDTNVTDTSGNKNSRAKRWIRHHSKGKLRRRHHKITSEYEMKDDKNSYPNINVNLIQDTVRNVTTPSILANKIVPENTQGIIKPFMSLEKLAKSVERHQNPFTTMAAKFCNQIGQNGNPQMLSWCVEKVLRKLQNIETIPVVATLQRTEPTPASNMDKNVNPILNATLFYFSATKSVTTPSPMPSQMGTVSTDTPKTPVTIGTLQPTPAVFFPDNDQLESNLKQYDLTPDDEGTVFYDGSLHASDILGNGESEGFSDIMPDMDSDSRIALDPLTFDLRTMRRASVRRMNENILRKKGIV